MVLLYGFEELREKVKAFEIGADDFFTKPISRAEVKITSALSSPIALKEPYIPEHTQKVLKIFLRFQGREWSFLKKDMRELKMGKPSRCR